MSIDMFDEKPHIQKLRGQKEWLCTQTVKDPFKFGNWQLYSRKTLSGIGDSPFGAYLDFVRRHQWHHINF